MVKQEILGATSHKIPADLRKALTVNSEVITAWNDITPLARNEWICWVESVKQLETRNRHIERVGTELLEGKRRPCCWAGCRHRD